MGPGARGTQRPLSSLHSPSGGEIELDDLGSQVRRAQAGDRPVRERHTRVAPVIGGSPEIHVHIDARGATAVDLGKIREEGYRGVKMALDEYEADRRTAVSQFKTRSTRR